MFKRIFFFPVIALLASFSFADHHEETEVGLSPEGADNLRAEYQFCTLNKGKTLRDVEKYAQKYGDFAGEHGVKYNQSLLIPVHVGSGMGDFTHAMSGHWPNGLEMYKDWGVYLNEFQEAYPNLKSPHTCSENYATFQLRVVRAIDETMEWDIKRPVQYADCSLNEGKSIEDAVAAERAVAELVASVGLSGYAVNYIFPYLGQRNPDYDFIGLSYYQNYMARGEMAFNYYKVEEEAEAITSEVYSCVNPRSFAVKNLYTNWENN
ncbi:MAG TPA: hypothetical protein EYQ44_05945 [Porticoccaceae bacterium]|nr:hypothetical protein [Porticoccaceae bacterium]HIK80010.1 hypothetical protein [Porticoccaceae bacterium]